MLPTHRSLSTIHQCVLTATHSPCQCVQKQLLCTVLPKWCGCNTSRISGEDSTHMLIHQGQLPLLHWLVGGGAQI